MFSEKLKVNSEKSFPRRRESTSTKNGHYRSRTEPPIEAWWIPAFAGMTGLVLLLFVNTAFGDGMTEPHPNYTRTEIMPQEGKFLVGGLGMFSNGDLAVCNWGNPGEVWVLDNPSTGSAASITSRRYAFGLQQSLGCDVVHDRVYVMEMGALTELIDHDGNGIADEHRVYNDNFATSESLLGYTYGLAYYGGSFYTSLASDVMFGGNNVTPETEGKSRFLKLSADNETENFASGFRNPNGLTRGFGNQFFAVDNQGVWLPASKINHVQPGLFYGHHMSVGNVFQPDEPGNNGEWPMAWLGDVSNNPGGLEFIKSGIFENQMLFAELQTNRQIAYRVSIEEVDGVFQAAIHPWSGGFSSGPSRIQIDDDGNVYVGILGSNGSWGNVTSMDPGLYRFVPNNQEPVFEILRVRSVSSNQIALDFTQPVNAAAGQAGNYTVRTWTYTPTVSYGGPKVDDHPLTVSDAVLSNSDKTVTLTIGGLQERYVVKISHGGSVTSSTGQESWGNQTWFTLNKFGPGSIPLTAGCMDAASPEYNPFATVSDPAGCVSTVSAKPMARESKGIRNIQYTGSSLEFMATNLTSIIKLISLKGKTVWSKKVINAYNISVPTQGLGKGMYILSYRHKGEVINGRVAIY